MKNTKLLLISISFCLVGLSSCEKAIVEDDPNSPVTMNMVRLTPKVLKVQAQNDELPAPNDNEKIYAVNISYKKKNAKSGTAFKPYAYGLFDDASLITIALPDSAVYNIECEESRNGEECIYHEGSVYYAPYYHAKNKPTELTNEFVLSSTETLDSIAWGTTNIDATSTTKYPKRYRYYGTVSNFDASQSETLTIDLRRAIFGLHFLITPPEEGSLTLEYLHRTIEVKAGDSAYDNVAVYSFNQLANAIQADYTGNVTFTLTWNHENGSSTVSSQVITLKRNVMTVINVSTEGHAKTGFTLNEEEGELTTETVDWLVKESY